MRSFVGEVVVSKKGQRPIKELVSDLRDDAQLLQCSTNTLDVWWSAWETLPRDFPRVFGTVKRCALDAAIASAGRLFSKDGLSLRNAVEGGFKVSAALQQAVDILASEYDEKVLLWRHKIVAHRDLKMSGNVASAKAKLSVEDLLSFSERTAIAVNDLISSNQINQPIQTREWMDRVDVDCSEFRSEVEALIGAALRP